MQSIDRYLRKNGYPLSLLNDKEFSEVQDILKKKQKQLKSIGKGNKPDSADPLTDTEQWYCDGVLGNITPRALLNTVWLKNCIFFGMRPGKEQRDLCWGDLELKVDAQVVRYVEFCTERQTKTRTGENPRNIRETRPKMFENPDNIERCPVTAFLCYKDQLKCSTTTRRFIYIYRVSASSQLQATKRKLVNHSMRKHLILDYWP